MDQKIIYCNALFFHTGIECFFLSVTGTLWQLDLSFIHGMLKHMAAFNAYIAALVTFNKQLSPKAFVDHLLPCINISTA